MPGSSRKHFYLSLVALVCVLGAVVFGQNAQAPQKAQSAVTADDFNQFSWRWVGPMTFSGRITGLRGAARPEPDLLRAHRERRRLEDG